MKNKKQQSQQVIDETLEKWSQMSISSSVIDSELYSKYDVKRGLRDVSGKGVLAGLTQIGEVCSYTYEGDKMIPIPGKLIYRGMEISDLVDGFTADGRLGFEETCYLILFGELPNSKELKYFEDRLHSYRKLPQSFVHDAILKMPSRDIMNAMSRSVLAMYVDDDNPEDLAIPNVLRQCLQLVATFPVLAVYAYQAYLHHYHNKSLVIHRPVKGLSTAENILHMLRPDSQYTETEAKLLDLALVLHAEHGGGNNSSFTTHVVSSSGTDTYGTIASALSSLKGPRHGGANIKAVQMFDDLKEHVKDWKDEQEIENYLTKVLNKEAFDKTGLVYGVGHAVYSISDPRTIILRDHAEALAKEKGVEEEYLLHTRVEKIAPEVIGKVRKMYKGVSANVDFYSGFIYKMLGIPSELFTPLFAISRIVGWSAHRMEELANRGKIIRPAYKSVAERRDYIKMGER